MNQTIQLRVKRNKSFVGCAMGIKVYFNNVEIYTLSNGDQAILNIPAQPGYLQFKMVGSSMAFHPIKGEVFIDPTACRQNAIDCQLSISANGLGVFTGGLFGKVGDLKINLVYL